MSAADRFRMRLGKSLQVTTAKQDPSQRPGFGSRSVFRVLKPGESIEDIYDFQDEMHSGGALSKVLSATRKADKAEMVIKIRRKGRDQRGERTWRQIMSQVNSIGGNRHVLDITEILEDETSFYVAMPKCDGGELFDFLMTAEEVPERECKRIIREILTAVGHLHANDLIHRDIKPENILFDSHKGDPHSPKMLKLIDFDTVSEWTPQSPKTKTFVGTPGYIAPEVLLGSACPQSDLWSVGVILYILMTGDSPWSSITSLEDGTVGSPKAIKMYEDMKSEVVCWEEDPWPQFPLARDLCQKLLAFNAEERPLSVKEALAHPWLRG